ncbi:MAG TPA: phage integrase SAM-like domain-containing protein [Pyrinomonadaceae bacterium]|nr:phage integrase SAM-like domain-containing protein [Pyrinomonadaceae bacterium]
MSRNAFKSITFEKILGFRRERHGKSKRDFQDKIDRLEKFKKIKARKLLPEMIDNFLEKLREEEEYAPSSVNHYRTIFNSAFNYAIKWKKYDDNPVAVISQIPEREAGGRFAEVSALAALIGKCRDEEKGFSGPGVLQTEHRTDCGKTR